MINYGKIGSRQLMLIFISILSGLLLATPVINSSLFDDAYIHARVAENFLHYGIPVFNEGNIFKVDSSTGFVLLIALFSRTVGTINAIRAIEFCAIFFTVSGLFWLSAQSQLKSAFFKLIFITLCTIPYMLLAAYGGMETPIVCMLITGATIAYYKKSYITLIFLISLCPWFRFETTLLVIVAVFCFRNKEKILIYTFPLIMLIITDYLLFGSVVPHAAKVKSIAYAAPLIDSVINALSFGRGRLGLVFGVILFSFVFCRLLKLARRFKLEYADILFIFSAGVLLAWFVGRSVIFPWYYALLTFPIGMALIVETKNERVFQVDVKKAFQIHEFFVILGIAVFGLSSTLAIFGLRGNDKSNMRVEMYTKIGSALYSFCPDCTLLTSEIGGLGYSFKGVVYDAFGLGDPNAVKYHPMKVPTERQGYYIGAIPPKYVTEKKPDFIVSMPVFSIALRTSSVIDSYYKYECPIGERGMKVVVFGDSTMQIFSKKKIPITIISSIGCEEFI